MCVCWKELKHVCVLENNNILQLSYTSSLSLQSQVHEDKLTFLHMSTFHNTLPEYAQ